MLVKMQHQQIENEIFYTFKSSETILAKLMCFTYSVQFYLDGARRDLVKGLVVKRTSPRENFVRKVPPFLFII